MSDPENDVLEYALREHLGAPERRDVTWRVLQELRDPQPTRRPARAVRSRVWAAAAAVIVLSGAAVWRFAGPAADPRARTSAEVLVFDDAGDSSPVTAVADGRVALATEDCRVELPGGIAFDAAGGTVFRWTRAPAIELWVGRIDVAVGGDDLVVRSATGTLELSAGSRALFDVSAPVGPASLSNTELARSLAMSPTATPLASTVVATLLAGAGTLFCSEAPHVLEPDRSVSVDPFYGQQDDGSGDEKNPFEGEAGTWDIEVTFPGAPGNELVGTETVRRGPHPLSIVAETSVGQGAGARLALMVLSWDPRSSEFSGSLTDSFGGPIGVVRGTRHDDGARVLELFKTDGSSFDLRLIVEWTGADERRSSFQSRDAGGEWTTGRQVIHRRRKADAPNPLFQVILDVRDMAKQVAFYRDILGYRVLAPEGDDPLAARFVVLETGGAQLALHLAEPVEGARPSAARLSLRVSSVEETRDRLRECGVEVGEVRRPAPGVAVLDVRDPEGNVVHFEEHAQAQQRGR